MYQQVPGLNMSRCGKPGDQGLQHVVGHRKDDGLRTTKYIGDFHNWGLRKEGFGARD